MAFTSTTSDQNISLTSEHAATQEPPLTIAPPRSEVVSTTIAGQERQDEIQSWTNSVPKSVWANWSRIAQAGMTTAMYERLVRIATADDGWRGPGSRALQPASLISFLTFWEAVHDEAVEPELALAPDGSLHAEWFKSVRQRLDIRFGEKSVVFGLFASDSILEGAERLDMVVSRLKSHPARPLTWSES